MLRFTTGLRTSSIVCFSSADCSALEVVICSIEVFICSTELLTCSTEVLTCSIELLTHFIEAPTCSTEAIYNTPQKSSSFDRPRLSLVDLCYFCFLSVSLFVCLFSCLASRLDHRDLVRSRRTTLLMSHINTYSLTKIPETLSGSSIGVKFEFNT